MSIQTTVRIKSITKYHKMPLDHLGASENDRVTMIVSIASNIDMQSLVCDREQSRYITALVGSAKKLSICNSPGLAFFFDKQVCYLLHSMIL